MESWKNLIKPKSGERHKYDYGHLVVYGGDMPGATMLAAVSALRMGCGLVTVAAPRETTQLYTGFCPSLITEERGNFKHHFEDKRRNAILIGPGGGKGLGQAVSETIQSGKTCILDADALSQLSLIETHGKCILTPHEGEFSRLFPDIKGDKKDRALEAAVVSKAIVVLKGTETIVAAPDGRTEIFSNGSPWLATAGTGDVLAGMIAGFAAYHEDALFEASCAAVWMHGEASQKAGPGMISADLPDLLPEIWRDVIK